MVNKTLIALATTIIATLGATLYLYNGEISNISLNETNDTQLTCKKG